MKFSSKKAKRPLVKFKTTIKSFFLKLDEVLPHIQREEAICEQKKD